MERKTLFTNRSERVKCVDFHAIEPWVLVGLYSGTINIWDYNTGRNIRTISSSSSPVRCARFIARKNWIIVGSDDLTIRIFNLSTGDRIASFEGHSDYIRSLAVHPNLPLVLSCSDDTTIKVWDWEKDWKCSTVFEGHIHYVMAVAFNPRDSNTFASASLDRTVKVWSLNGGGKPNFSLDGHAKVFLLFSLRVSTLLPISRRRGISHTWLQDPMTRPLEFGITRAEAVSGSWKVIA